MTTGALIFAQNNGVIDYVKLAIYAAKQVNKYLGIPVSIATDSAEWLEKAYPDHPFDKVIPVFSSGNGKRSFHDGTLSSKILEWKNSSRTKIYNITPYDKTLVIDSDYIINSSILLPALTYSANLQIYRKSLDLTTWRKHPEFERLNDHSIPFYWATTFIFEKNETTEAFFDIVDYIKQNWSYFRALYNIETSVYRNDYAFSIAIHLMNGKTDGGFAAELPGSMVYTIDKDILIEIKDDAMKFLVEKQDHLGEYTAAKTTGLDVHVMNKLSLARCIEEVENV